MHLRVIPGVLGREGRAVAVRLPCARAAGPVYFTAMTRDRTARIPRAVLASAQSRADARGIYYNYCTRPLSR